MGPSGKASALRRRGADPNDIVTAATAAADAFLTVYAISATELE